MHVFSTTTARLALCAALGVWAAHAHAADVHVRIHNVQSDAGEVLLALFDGPASFLKTAVLSTKVAAASRTGGKSVTLVFKNVPAGRYALSGFHDRNGNAQLDRNLVGLPQEPVAFSNGAQVRMGPPSFGDAAFAVQDQDLHMDLHLK
jgi:uncharacterized protein (DUF2141 family)